MQKRIFYCSLSLALSGFSPCLFAQDSTEEVVWSETAKNEPRVTTQEDALFLRRVVEFYEEGLTEVAIKEVEDFLKKFPKSSLCDSLHLLLGDYALLQEDPSTALTHYGSIVESSDQRKALLNQLNCFYKLEKFDELVDKGTAFLSTHNALDREERLALCHLVSIGFYKKIELLKGKGDEQKALTTRAVPYFEALLESAHDTDAKVFLASSYAILGEAKRSSLLYKELAELETLDKEDYLMRAAQMERLFDMDLSLQTYAQVCCLEGKRAPMAALQRLAILFEQKRYSDIVLIKDQMWELVSKDKQGLVQLMIGKSFFALEDYKRAKEAFNQFMQLEEGESASLYSAMTDLLYCAEKTADEPLFVELIEKMERHYPQSPLLGKALFAYALYAKKQGDLATSKELFARVEQATLSSEFQEAFAFEYGHLLFLTKEWSASRLKLRQYLEKYQDHYLSHLGWHYLIHASIKLAESEADAATASKSLLSLDLQAILLQPDLLTENERGDYLFLLGKTKFFLKDYEDAKAALEACLNQYPNLAARGEAHFYIGMIEKERGGDLNLFCNHMEKALTDGGGINNRALVHLLLFNGYQQMANKTPEIWEQMAYHLYAYQTEHAISQANQLWLSHYYYDKSVNPKSAEVQGQRGGVFSYQKAVSLLEKMVSQLDLRSIDQDTLFLEQKAVELADLYFKYHNPSKAVELLNKLLVNYENLKDLPWQYKNRVLCLLGLCYREMGDKSRAIAFFDQLSEESILQSPFVAVSILEGARLKLGSIDEKKVSNPDMVHLLSMLKNLTICRRADYEPVHLEAALDYIDIQCLLDLEQETPVERRLSLTSMMKERFSSGVDLVSQDYQALLNQFPEKKALVSTYLLCMQAEILFCQLQLCEEAEKEGIRFKMQALFEEVQASPALTPYLDARINRYLEAL